MAISAATEGRQAKQRRENCVSADQDSRASALEYFRSLFEVSDACTPSDLEAVFRLRYQIYCVENAFEAKEANPGLRETDRYDWRSVHSVLKHRASKEVIGTLRLVLPFGGPLPIQELRPNPLDFVKGHLPLKSTAEVSRFAVSRSFRRRRGEERYADQGWTGKVEAEENAPLRRLMPYLSVGLIQGGLKLSLRHGVTHLCAIIDPALLRLLGRFGLHFHAIGEPVDYHGLRQPCFAELDDLIRCSAIEQPELWAVGTENGGLLSGWNKPQAA